MNLSNDIDRFEAELAYQNKKAQQQAEFLSRHSINKTFTFSAQAEKERVEMEAAMKNGQLRRQPTCFGGLDEVAE